MYQNGTIKKIVLADDHVSVREGLARIIEEAGGFEIVGSANNGRAVLQFVEKERPDIVITDIRMPEMDGLAAGSIIKERYPQIGVIAYMNEENDYLISRLLHAGFDGIILKRTGRDETISAIHLVLAGQEYHCSYAQERVRALIQSGKYNPRSRAIKLIISKREREVLQWLCKGLKSQEIAEEMDLSIRTVEDYRSSLMKKTNSNSLATLVVYAYQEGLVEPTAG